ncbi:imm11 family protein [Gimesia sp.]|uniref:imm11 family protein n=1 Tax=Gimesia sp. TaxID=2024833 RepID=UPI003A90F026
MHYYQLVMATDDRWTLSICREFPDGSPVDKWAYTRCQTLASPSPVPFQVRVQGDAVDYNSTAFGCLVVSTRMGQIIEEISPDEIQRIPALVDAEGDWEVLNLLHCVDCIDFERSDIQFYPDDHPEKAGKPRGVKKLRISGASVGSCHIFRPRDWTVAEIVSEKVKQALEGNGIKGIEYWPVTE